MKHKLLKIALCTAGLFVAAQPTHAQMLQTLIGSSNNRNELITSVKALPDGSAVLGGYIYDIVSNQPTHLDMLLLRVRADGSIIWQKQIGTPDDDLMNSVIVTANSDIVAMGTVGRTGAYSDNTGAILRFDSSGTLLWQRYIRLNPATGAPGEVLSDITELSNGTLIAVGGATAAPSASQSLICSISASGNINYLETRNRPNSDNYFAVYPVGNDVIIAGWYDGATYKDSRIMRYRPGTTSGTIIWDNSFDVAGATDATGLPLSSDGISKVFVRGGKVLASAKVDQTWNATPSIHSVFECDVATGANAKIRGLLTKQYNYANNVAFYPIDSATIYVAQNPATSLQDAVLWTSPSFTNGLISKIRLFGATGQVLAAREFNLPGSQSIFSMDYYGGALLMAGCSNSGTTTVNNDIYFVVSMSSLTNPNKTCDLVDDSLWVTSPTLVPQTPTETIAYPTSTFTKTLTFSNPGLVSTKACGEVVVLSREGATTTAVPTTQTGNNGFTLYPNPATNNVTLELKGVDMVATAQVQIMNATGQLVQSTVASFDASGKSILNTAQLAPGTYFLRLSNSDQVIGTRMLFIR